MMKLPRCSFALIVAYNVLDFCLALLLTLVPPVVVAAHCATDLNRYSSRENLCRSVARLMRNQNLKMKMVAQMMLRQR